MTSGKTRAMSRPAIRSTARRPRGPEGEDLVQAGGVQPGVDFSAGEQRLDLGREVEVAALQGIEQGQDAEAVAREKYRSRAAVIYREGELAVQAAGQAVTPF